MDGVCLGSDLSLDLVQPAVEALEHAIREAASAPDPTLAAAQLHPPMVLVGLMPAKRVDHVAPADGADVQLVGPALNRARQISSERSPLFTPTYHCQSLLSHFCFNVTCIPRPTPTK